MKKFLCFMALTCLMSACGTPKEREVNVSDIPITGFIKDYVKVVDGSYRFTNDGRVASISVKLELTKHPDVDYHETRHPSIRLNAMNEYGEIFDSGMYGFTAQGNEFKKANDLLMSAVGESKIVAFTWQYFGQNKELGKRIFKETTSFELIDNGFEYGDMGEFIENGYNLDQSSSKSSDSSDWNKVLDEYEKYVDSYIRLVKKAMDGDISAMAEYVTMLEKAQSMATNLENAKTEMTTAQASRYVKISAKMLDAVQ